MTNLSKGDTIVEVLLAIAIAAFAIGISYATAQRSLQKSITAREHNEALNEAENQIADLNLRFQNDSDFANHFANQNHFCLNDSSKSESDTGFTNQWAVYNNQAVDLSSPLDSADPSTSSKPYDTGCVHQRTGDGAAYYVDITVDNSGGGINPAVYTISIRWEQLNGNQHNQVGLSYKLNGYSSKTLGLSTVGVSPSPPTPPTSCTGTPWLISEDDKATPPRTALLNQNGKRAFYGDWAPSWTVDPSCSYTIQITAHNGNTAPPNQQMFVELCADITTTCSLSGNSASPMYRSLTLTTDITASSPGSYSDKFSLSAAPKYILFKHCSLWPTSVGTCKNAAFTNVIGGYDVTITPGP